MSSRGSRDYGIVDLASRLAGRTISGYADGGALAAGAIAFRVLFSVFPLAIALSAIFGIVVRATGVQADVISSIVDNVPLTESSKGDLEKMLEGATGGASTIGLVALLGLVWSASGMMGAIRSALNRAWGVEHARPYVRGKLVDLSLVLAVGLLVLLSLALGVGARMTTAYASSVLDRVGMSAGVLEWLVGFLLPATLVAVGVAFLYRVVPATRERPAARVVLPVGAVVGLAFAGLQSLFGFYLSHFADYNAVYGSLGAVIAFLSFVYLAATLFLLGAHAAASVPRVIDELERGEQPSPGPDAPFLEKLIGALRGLVLRTGEEERPGDERAASGARRPPSSSDARGRDAST